ncbi:MAG: mechanosensitive ion channel family protein [Burkholderiaceae bacterium]
MNAELRRSFVPRSAPRALAALIVMLLALASAPCLSAPEPAASEAPAKVDTTIAVKSDAATDAGIKRRVRQLFATVEGLHDLRVDVSGGVVELSGEASSKGAHEQALQLVRRVENVVDVRDGITVSRDLRARMSQMLDRLSAQLTSFIEYVPLLLVAGLILLIFWWIGNGVARSNRITRRFARNPFLRDLARQILRAVFVGIGLLLALEVLDASTLVGSVLGAAGVLGLAVGFALRDTVENYIASLLLSLRQPFSRDDLVSLEGCEGRVLRLTARATILLTLDGNHTRIPNAKVYKAVIVNYTRNPKRRFQFDVGVDTEQNLAAAQSLAATTLAQMDGVLRDPPPTCTVEQLGDSNVILRVFGWVNQAEAEFVKVRSEAIRLVKGAFDRASIVMPEPIYNVRLGQFPAALASAPASTAPSAGTSSSGPLPSAVSSKPRESEPPQAIDVAPTDELDDQIAADRRPDEEDLLRHKAARE